LERASWGIDSKGFKDLVELLLLSPQQKPAKNLILQPQE
jgi:hypothetical protein